MYAANPEFMIEWWERGFRRLMWFGIFVVCLGGLILVAYIWEKINKIKERKK